MNGIELLDIFKQRVPRRRRWRTVCAAALAVWLAMAGHEAARTRGAARWARSVEPRPRARGRRHGGRLGPHRRTVCRHGSSPPLAVPASRSGPRRRVGRTGGPAEQAVPGAPAQHKFRS